MRACVSIRAGALPAADQRPQLGTLGFRQRHGILGLAHAGPPVWTNSRIRGQPTALVIAPQFIRDRTLEVFVIKLAVKDLAADTTCQEGLPPLCFNWYYHTLIPGGVSGWSPQVILDLPAGVYGLWGPGELSILLAATLTVTGDPGSLQSPAPNRKPRPSSSPRRALAEPFRLSVEGPLTPGPQIVAVVNAADQPVIVGMWRNIRGRPRSHKAVRFWRLTRLTPSS